MSEEDLDIPVAKNMPVESVDETEYIIHAYFRGSGHSMVFVGTEKELKSIEEKLVYAATTPGQYQKTPSRFVYQNTEYALGLNTISHWTKEKHITDFMGYSLDF